MLNPMAMPAAKGGRHASYLWKEAVALDAPELRVPRTELEFHVKQISQDWSDFDDVVELEYAKRLARVEAAGVEHIDHIMLWDKAADDVAEAFIRLNRASGVEYRQDTTPELAALLKFDPASPRLSDLKHLLSARTADGSQIPGRLYHPDRKNQMTMGSLELVFSADKSVSVVFGLANPEERRAIVKAQREAVDRAMHQVAGKIGVKRSRRGGLDKRDPADVTWVQWQHWKSRRGDPQLHTHVSLLNVVRSRVDGSTGTLDTFLLHGLYPDVRATYHHTLADELRKVGLVAEFDTKMTAAVIRGVPDQVLRHFSGRTAEAEQWLKQKLGPNFATLTPHQRSTWLTSAAAKTRPTKATHAVPGNGHAEWCARATDAGYAPPTRTNDQKHHRHRSIADGMLGVVDTIAASPGAAALTSAVIEVSAKAARVPFNKGARLARGI